MSKMTRVLDQHSMEWMIQDGELFGLEQLSGTPVGIWCKIENLQELYIWLGY